MATGNVALGDRIETVSSRVVADGQELEVQQHVVSSGAPTIVLLHEALGSVSHWRDFPLLLAESTQHNTVSYSRVGHGESSGSPERRSYDYFARQADVLRSLLDRLNIDRPVLFGHSEGASISILFAAAHPDSAAALVLEAPILVIEDVTVNGLRKAVEAYRTTDLSRRLARHHRDADAVFRAWVEPWVEHWISAELGISRLRESLKSIHCPVLAFQGDNDEYATSKQLEVLRECVPSAHISTIADCGHTPHREKPDAVLRMVAQFLSGDSF
jgi:pimeloyl-ACP methyl ester carboxylesterase